MEIILSSLVIHEGTPRKSILGNNGNFNINDKNIYRGFTPLGILGGMEEMNKEEQMFAILCNTVQSLRGRKEYDIIETLYNQLLEYNIIHSIEDFKEGKLIEGSMEEALIYWTWRALVQYKGSKESNNMIEEQINKSPEDFDNIKF